VFSNELVDPVPAEADGAVMECRDPKGRFLGSGICNSRSQIAWRRFSREKCELDDAFIRGALQRAIARREKGAVRRLVWSEADELPGLVVDQYGDTLVVQTQTLALEKWIGSVLALLGELLTPSEIIVRNDAPIRRLEGLQLEVRTASGRPWEPRWVDISGFRYWLDLQGGQKTGFYLDQVRQHPLVARFAEGARVLDAFCNQGSFGLHAARAGAARVLGIDSSEEAVALARKNAEANGVAAEFTVANVFDHFSEAREETWDLIVPGRSVPATCWCTSSIGESWRAGTACWSSRRATSIGPTYKPSMRP
jgi:23S rRNA (cytosine1962-C5)-methyltransferase